MTRVESVKKEIERLDPTDLEEIGRWLDEKRETQWDAQIAHDYATGKLDDLIQRAKAEAQAGTLKDIPK